VNPAELALLKMAQMEKFANCSTSAPICATATTCARWSGRGGRRKDRPWTTPRSTTTRYWAIPDLANIINDYLSPGLNALPGWRGVRKLQNSMTAARLLLAFHAR
jgi:hypothetical protein